VAKKFVVETSEAKLQSEVKKNRTVRRERCSETRRRLQKKRGKGL
jgi:hypothetical protein